MVNGNWESDAEREILFEGIQCLGGCVKDVDVVEISDEYIYWSHPEEWPDKHLPEEGEDVEILAGWNMILDVADPPILNMIRINGRLTFSNNQSNPIDIHL